MNTDLDIKIKQIAGELAASFVKNYKCSLGEAEDFFYNNISGNDEVRKLIMNAASDKQLAKNAAFKDFIKKNKKELYYKLRKYKNNDDRKDALLDAIATASEENRIALLKRVADFHVSSNERFSYNDLFYEQLGKAIGGAATIVDVGCGVQPLFLPRAQFPSISKYTALDKDRESVELMEKVKGIFPDRYDWLQPQVWNIADGWGIEDFDAALLLKLVSVVKRVNPALLDVLARTPAQIMIISGVKESMVKKQDVERRERKAINSFITASGRKAVDEFELENEFFIIVN